MNNKLKMEFIGTFFLVLVVGLTGNPFAIGAVLMVLVYMGGYISGAHYNPAVTIALWVTDKVKIREAIQYILVQLVAGVAAAAVYHLISGFKFVPQVSASAELPAAFLIEVLGTFLLASVVLHVAATDKTKGNQYFGLAIGFTLLAMAYMGGPISGGAFNQAVGLSPLLYDFENISSNLMNMSIYLFGPLTGGVLAGLIYKSFQERIEFVRGK